MKYLYCTIQTLLKRGPWFDNQFSFVVCFASDMKLIVLYCSTRDVEIRHKPCDRQIKHHQAETLTTKFEGSMYTIQLPLPREI